MCRRGSGLRVCLCHPSHFPVHLCHTLWQKHKQATPVYIRGARLLTGAWSICLHISQRQMRGGRMELQKQRKVVKWLTAAEGASDCKHQTSSPPLRRSCCHLPVVRFFSRTRTIKKRTFSRKNHGRMGRGDKPLTSGKLTWQVKCFTKWNWERVHKWMNLGSCLDKLWVRLIESGQTEIHRATSCCRCLN